MICQLTQPYTLCAAGSSSNKEISSIGQVMPISVKGLPLQKVDLKGRTGNAGRRSSSNESAGPRPAASGEDAERVALLPVAIEICLGKRQGVTWECLRPSLPPR